MNIHSLKNILFDKKDKMPDISDITFGNGSHRIEMRIPTPTIRSNRFYVTTSGHTNVEVTGVEIKGVVVFTHRDESTQCPALESIDESDTVISYFMDDADYWCSLSDFLSTTHKLPPVEVDIFQGGYR